jgi:hypothetical protein
MHPRNTKAGIGAKVRGWSKAPGQGEREGRLGFLARWGVLRTPGRDKLIEHGSYLAAQVKGTTGEGLSVGSAQRKWRFGRVYSPGCGDGIPPAGRGGFHPERGATPVSNGRGFAFRNPAHRHCDGLSQRPFLRGPEFREVGACRYWPRRSRNRVSILAGPQKRIPRILGAGAVPYRAFLGLPRNIKARLPETLERTDLRSKS